MADFEIEIKKVSSKIQLLDQSISNLQQDKERVEKICGALSISGCAVNTVKRNLNEVSQHMNQYVHNTSNMKSVLSNIVSQYTNAEKKALSNKIQRNAIVTVHQYQGESIKSKDNKASEEDFWNTVGKDFRNDFWENFGDNLRDAFFEGTGNVLVKIGGWLNVLTATAVGVGNNAFVIVNPAIVPATSKIISVGGKIVTGAKWGLPVIGGIIDFFSLKGKGESNQDALVKAGAHVGIGIAGGNAGAAIGAGIGSVFPVVGTVAGAVIGFVAGVAITTIGNAVFDYTYDHWDEVVDGVKEFGNQVMTKIDQTFDQIGQAVSGMWNQLGTIFG